MNAVFAIAPALPLHSAGKYVAGAYIVFAVMLIVYLGIMGVRLMRTQRELAEMKRQLDEAQAAEKQPDRDLEHV
ncbi:MAG TPA: hypothetical protein VMD48_05585 [Solirubrobacteraceae bacterium]|jgi:hypothetical protein|nr:hypothetical protein [Solirubrobacteraceae bacterium]